MNNTKTGKGFAQAFYYFPACKLHEMQDYIMKRMGWALSTFLSKRNGTRKLRNSEIEVLKQIFSDHNIEF